MKSPEVKKLEHEFICLINSWRPDKKRIREIKKQLKQLNKNSQVAYEKQKSTRDT
jgi:hypothetical protein